MDIFEDFEQMKVELREKWLDYYEINHGWIKSAGLHQGMAWNVTKVGGDKTTIYCPDSALILGVISSLDERITSFIQISDQLSGMCSPDEIVTGLGLRFDPGIALKEREEDEDEEEEDEDDDKWGSPADDE